MIIPFEGRVAVCDREHKHFKLCRIGRECEKHGEGVVDTYRTLLAFRLARKLTAMHTRIGVDDDSLSWRHC